MKFTTYKMADGSLVYGEFSFVTETEFFDDTDEPCEVVKEVWVRESVETLTFGESSLCPDCNGEGEIETFEALTPTGVATCPTCDGSGERGASMTPPTEGGDLILFELPDGRIVQWPDRVDWSIEHGYEVQERHHPTEVEA